MNPHKEAMTGQEFLALAAERDRVGRTDDSLEARLRATLNMIPAYTWYAAPSGALTCVNERCADYLGLAEDHQAHHGVVQERHVSARARKHQRGDS
jgi:hypothetical protein